MIWNGTSGGVRALPVVKRGRSVDEVWDNRKHTLVAQALLERVATVCCYHATTYYIVLHW